AVLRVEVSTHRCGAGRTLRRGSRGVRRPAATGRWIRLPVHEWGVLLHVLGGQERRAERGATHARGQPPPGGPAVRLAGRAARAAAVPPQDGLATVPGGFLADSVDLYRRRRLAGALGHAGGHRLNHAASHRRCSTEEVSMQASSEFFVGWGTLSLINAGLAQS